LIKTSSFWREFGWDFGFDKKVFENFLLWHGIETRLRINSFKSYAKKGLTLKNVVYELFIVKFTGRIRAA
jgi:hypothetical protein